MTLKDEPRTVRWYDRYDALALWVGLVVSGVLLPVGVDFWFAIAIGFAVFSLSSFALRRRAGVPQLTIWQSLRDWLRLRT